MLNVPYEAIRLWEHHLAVPQIHKYPLIIAFLGYNPFTLDSNTITGQLVLLRHWHGLSYKAFAKLFNVDGSTVRDWELRNVIFNEKDKSVLHTLWARLPQWYKQQYRPN